MNSFNHIIVHAGRSDGDGVIYAGMAPAFWHCLSTARKDHEKRFSALAVAGARKNTLARPGTASPTAGKMLGSRTTL